MGAIIFQEPARGDNSGNLVDDNELFLTAEPVSYTKGSVYASNVSHNEKTSLRMAVRALLRTKSWDSDLAYRIIGCESSFNPKAHNLNHNTRDDSWGLFQINLYGNLKYERPSPDWLVDIENNINYAYELYKVSGWSPWLNCYNKEK